MKKTLQENRGPARKKNKKKDINNKAATAGCYKNNEKVCDDCKRTDCPEEEA